MQVARSCLRMGMLLWGLGLVWACSVTTSFDGLAGKTGGAVDGSTDAATVKDAAVVDARTDAPLDGGPSYPSEVLADSPISYYRLDDAVGSGVAHDEMGTHDATVSGGVVFGVGGVAGTAARFTSGAMLDVGAAFDLGASEASGWSVEAWIMASPTANFQNIAIKRQGSIGFVLYVRTDGDGGPAVQMEQGWGTDGRVAWGPISTSSFAHVVATCSPTDGPRIYVNGVSVANRFDKMNDGGPPPNPATFFWGNAVVGPMDELAVYDHALSATRVQAHYRAGKM